MSIYKTIIVVVVSFIFFNGCASFRDGANPTITQWPPENAIKNKNIAIQMTGNLEINGKPAETNARFLENWRNQVLRAYEDSNFFSAIKSGGDTADIYADINILDKGENNKGLAFITGFTMGLIPSHVREGFIIKTTYKDKSGAVLGTVEKSEYTDFWIQLFMFPLMPFNWPSSVGKDILYDLNRNSLIEGHAKGIF
ncbi:hypothetical protein [Methylomonas sp. AM2-LC]|uniref:hypothetical protein n=1 Tax=Methylomonas sp. AM2-LC TaxID=3153301 RepID=UPI0032640A0F